MISIELQTQLSDKRQKKVHIRLACMWCITMSRL